MKKVFVLVSVLLLLTMTIQTPSIFSYAAEKGSSSNGSKENNNQAANIIASGSFITQNGEPICVLWSLDNAGNMKIEKDGKPGEIWGATNFDEIPKQYREATKKIEFGESVTSLSCSEFRGFDNVKAIAYSANMKTLIDCPFAGLPLEEITIPENPPQWDAGTFDGLKELKKVTINCSKIDCTAYNDGVETYIIGPNVSHIQSRAFKDAYDLKTVVFMGDCDYDLSVFENASDLKIYRKKGNTLMLEEYIGSYKKVKIPSKANGYKITQIGDYAFEGKNRITSVILPDTIKTINKYAFYGCTRLETISLQNGLKSIGAFAFYGCNSLNSMKLPDTMKSIGERAFWNCYGIKYLRIPTSVQTIGEKAFESCKGLRTLDVGVLTTAEIIRNTLVEEVYADSKKNGLTINPYAFKNCQNLKKVTLGKSVVSIQKGAFINCGKMTSVSIGREVKVIGADAFKNCKKISKATIGNKVKTIGNNAFYNCKNLTTVTLGNNTTSIGANSFAYCGGLKVATLGKKIKSIGSKAFFKCAKLKTIKIRSTLIKNNKVGSKAFKGIYKKATFKVPKKKLKAYKKILLKKGATKKMKFKKL